MCVYYNKGKWKTLITRFTFKDTTPATNKVLRIKGIKLCVCVRKREGGKEKLHTHILKHTVTKRI